MAASETSLVAEWERIVLTALLVLILVLGLVGNVVVCAAIYFDYRLRQQVSNVFISGLAFTDLLTVAIVIPSCAAALLRGEWTFGTWWCQAIAFFYYSLAIVALETLSLISLDRFYAIVRPLRYQTLITAPRAKLALFACCVWAWLFSLPCVFLGWFRYGQHESMCTYHFSGTGDVFRLRVMVYGLFTITLCIGLPFSVLVVCYLRIFIVVRRQSNRVLAVPREPALPQRCRGARAYKGYQTIFLVIFLFILSWMPFCVTRVAKIIAWNHELVPAGVDTFSTVFSFLSAATNPLVYGMCRRDFRRAFKKLYRQLGGKLMRNRVTEVGREGENLPATTAYPGMELLSFWGRLSHKNCGTE